MGLYEAMWYFFFYAFLGWCCEVCFAAAKSGRFINRGFLNGPICPIYGFGVVLAVWLLTPVKGNLPLLFVCSVILTSALEWVTGFVLEKAFHQKWWDYSSMPLQLGGYICLRFSLLWGLACVFILDVAHPMTAALVSRIPRMSGSILLTVLLSLALADLCATVATVAKLNRRLRCINELAARVHEVSDSLGGHLSEAALVMTEQGEELKEGLAERQAERAEELARRRQTRAAALKRREAALAELRLANEELLSSFGFGQRRLLRAFPEIRSTRHFEAMEQLKARAKERKKKRRGGGGNRAA